MRRFLIPLLTLLLLGARTTQAQELKVQVQISTENVTISDRQLVQQMQNDMQTFLNTRSFTNQTYRPDERISCRLFVGINKIPENGLYEATARLISTRPVYGTGYETNMVSYEDALRNADSVNDLRLQIKLNSQRARTADLASGTEHLTIV